ncbi:unnamed protein product [Rotaria sordida]|nr:unnamed protein product [Rotaria sordida]CAF3900808.1 unnamed protein product [Rotaria sordida]
MSKHPDIPSHCVAQWEDDKEQYAVVDIRRSKTVSTLKVGITTLFEGYQRQRRRGKIIFLGSKKECFSYEFDLVEDDNQLNLYSWSNSPGLREQSEEIAQTIRTGTLSSFQRTTSSSSTCSNTLPTKHKRKKINEKNINSDELTSFDDTSMPPPPTTSVVSSSQIINSVMKDVVIN